MFISYFVAETRLKNLLVLRRLDWKALPLPLYIRVIKSLNKCRFGCRNKLFVPFPFHFWNGNLGNLVLHLFVLISLQNYNVFVTLQNYNAFIFDAVFRFRISGRWHFISGSIFAISDFNFVILYRKKIKKY